MPIIDVNQDPANRTLTMTAHFDAPVERIWALYADPRQLEKVWGPPEYPATFPKHELTPGGTSHYYMTSPEGEKFAGFWNVTAVDENKQFSFDDGFALNADDFAPNPDLPVSKNTYRFTPDGDGTRAEYISVYASDEALAQVLEMGMVEGATTAINQIDEFLKND
ncbi:MAG: SRPBCC domain-containing protein [Gordonia sp. (in: high G+C Gram-positive bacteria)]|uniref:SRPBCC family protein n=1 Tax=Gordonia sp. (in: high G+C Gram-positive bacteria) TaxID=84139 RepID=UPI0039E5F1AC